MMMTTMLMMLMAMKKIMVRVVSSSPPPPPPAISGKQGKWQALKMRTARAWQHISGQQVEKTREEAQLREQQLWEEEEQ